jgi:hypothetical protein
MEISTAYLPHAIFAPSDRGDLSLMRSALLDAHRLGLSVAQKIGDAAYRRLHSRNASDCRNLTSESSGPA